jgi:SAM-dependent methyltransferase
MDDATRQGFLPAWAAEVQHACPRCRTAIGLEEGKDAHCPSCGFMAKFERGVYCFLVESGPVNQWQNTYDKLATGAVEDTRSGLLYRFPVEDRIKTYRLLCGETPVGTRILDIGCANGIFSEVLFEGQPTVGIDFSLEMCRQARSHGVFAHQADALALPLADDQFDIVCIAGVLEHIDDLWQLCAELARVCRPGGRVVLGTANRVSLARLAMRIVRRVKPASLPIMRLPVIMRTMDDLLPAALGASLDLDMVCWTYLPLPWHRCSKSPRSLLAPLASNVYARFIKQPKGQLG